MEEITLAEGSRLKVLHKIEDSTTSKKKRFYYMCECSCGKIKRVRSDALKTTKSCGCLTLEAANRPEQIARLRKACLENPRQKENIIGRVFGRLTVVEEDEPTTTPKGRKLNYWKCSCRCGNTHRVEASALRQGKILSCGCVYPEYVDSDFMSIQECFLDKAKKVHGDKYTYDKTEYLHSKIKVIVTCPTHGDFLAIAGNFLMGCGCKPCSVDNRRTGREKFIEQSQLLFGDALSYDKVVYQTSKDPVVLTCKIHGDFEVKPNSHLTNTFPCPECSLLGRRMGQEGFLERAKAAYGDLYDYSLTEFEHSTKPIKIICKTHGVFEKEVSTFLQGHGCQSCAYEERASKQHWNYIKRCEINPLLQNRVGYLYLLEMTHEDERFLKIGVSKEYKKRLNRYTEFGVSYKPIVVFEFDTTHQSAVIEKELLTKIKDNGMRYIPKHKFKGWTECAAIEHLDFILKFFSDNSLLPLSGELNVKP